MTKAGDLEDALHYRDRLNSLLQFKSGLETWNGDVVLSFGPYKAVLSTGCTKDALLGAIAVEEKMLVNTLELLGVELQP
jgi:hypothetical protein